MHVELRAHRGSEGGARAANLAFGVAAGYHSIDLARFALHPGDGRRLDLDVNPGRLELAGQSYGVTSDVVSARLDLSRTGAGYAIRMRATAQVSGPCMRCLADADVPVEIDAREVDQPASEDEELHSPYVEGEELDVGSWMRDALALAFPFQLLCRPDCRGLCPVCGASLNDVDPQDHHHETASDPRWAKLRELKLD